MMREITVSYDDSRGIHQVLWEPRAVLRDLFQDNNSCENQKCQLCPQHVWEAEMKIWVTNKPDGLEE